MSETKPEEDTDARVAKVLAAIEESDARATELRINENLKEFLIVGMLLTACMVATWLEAATLAASLGGAAVALVLPRVPTGARVAIVAGAVGFAQTACSPTQLKAGFELAATAACIAVKPVCTEATRICGPVLALPSEPVSSGGESPITPTPTP